MSNDPVLLPHKRRGTTIDVHLDKVDPFALNKIDAPAGHRMFDEPAAVIEYDPVALLDYPADT